MGARLRLLPLCLLLAGCGGTLVENQERNIVSSLPYDTIPCEALLARRAELAGRYGLPEDAAPVVDEPATGLGPVMPDLRSGRQRAAEEARGEIAAMSRSLTRRKCASAPKKG